MRVPHRMIRWRVLAAAVALGTVASLAAAVPASAAPAPGLCHMNTARGAVPAKFPIEACVDGANVWLYNDTTLVVRLGTEGDIGTPITTPTDVTLAVDATRYVHGGKWTLMPGDKMQIPIGSGLAGVKAAVNVSAERYYALANTLATFIPLGQGVDAFDSFADFVTEVNADFTKYANCRAGRNFLGQAGCYARFDADITAAIAHLGISAFSHAGHAILNVLLATKTFLQWFGVQVPQLATFINSPPIMQATVTSPSAPPTATPAPSPSPTPSESDTGSWTDVPGVLPSDGSDEAELTGVSCPPSSPCVVVGNTINGSSYETPFLLTGSGQSWTVTDAPAPGGATMTNYILGAVSCPSAAQCVAIGAGEFTGDNPVKYGAVAVTKSGGSWSAVQVPLPASMDSSQGLTMTGISCPSASFCVATGYYTDSTANHYEHGLLLTWSGGSWTATQAPLPSGAASNVDVKLTGVSCPSARQCTATGTYIPNSNVEGLLLSWSGASWTAAYAPLPSNAEGSGQIALANGVSCASAAQCVAVGTYGDTSGYTDGVLLTGSGGSWTAAEAPRPTGDGNLNSPLAGVSCLSATQCAVLGRAYATPTLLTLSGGSWTAAELPLPSNISGPNDPYALSLSGISCASATQCVAVGYYSDTAGHVDELLMTGAS